MASSPYRKSSKTKFYDKLGVSRNATDADVKKAYRKKALQTHPDKGGSHEDFTELKYARDALADHSKRRVNDWFGDVGVQVYESRTASPEQMAQIFIGLDFSERFLMLMAIIVCLGYLLLFPILLSIRWDYPNSMSFAHVFIPVWLGLSAILLCSVCVFIQASPEGEDDELSESRKENELAVKKASIVSTIIIAVLFGLLIVLVLRLDGHTDWSFFFVIWPWIVVELLFFGAAPVYVLSLSYEELSRLELGLSRLEIGLMMVQRCLHGLSGLELTLALVEKTSPYVFHIIFACNLAWKLDGITMSWWEVFWPIWASVALCLLLQAVKWTLLVKPEAEVVDKEKELHLRISIKANVVRTLIYLGIVLLLCWKLAHPRAFPAFIIFLPLFAIAGCVCCVLSCILICPLDAALRMDEDESTVIPQGGSTYNTV